MKKIKNTAKILLTVGSFIHSGYAMDDIVEEPVISSDMQRLVISFSHKNLNNVSLVCKNWKYFSDEVSYKVIFKRQRDYNKCGYPFKLYPIELLSRFSNLKCLDIEYHNSIDICGILSKLTKLNNLGIRTNSTITDEILSHLTNLTSIDLWNNRVITDLSVAILTNLTSLYLWNNTMITDHSVSNLTNLTNLNLSGNNLITVGALSKLTKLTILGLENNKTITNIKHNTLPDLIKILR